MTDIPKFSIVKPTTQTPFRIDFEWWQKNDNNWRVHLQSCLCAEHQAAFMSTVEDEMIDFVDPETAEVIQIDPLQNVLINHCAKMDSFITENTTLVDSVFRCLLANGNQPLNSQELSALIGKSAIVILRTLTGPTIYMGIRPCNQ
ncbi:MAG: hypothetical protein HPY76_04700 [Anaerolineae bacterium]|nr:hypothetical protein [Anaerolineae bacterium]